jgi:Asp-tRNA(Asn)/Glu-tRNA(Gln) amidotransferase A subunit family amidase
MRAVQMRDLLVAGEFSVHDVLNDAVQRLATAEPTIHAFLTVDEDFAHRQAEELIERRRAGEPAGPLWGVPFTVKDTFDTADMRTTYGSRLYAESVPRQDAELVRRVRAAGGILLGKTNTPEFAIHIRTVNEIAPETRNPWNSARTSGGSSGGAAASVSAEITPIAIGSDGGGSVRIPSALCGTVGLLPSRGAIPRPCRGISTRRFSSAGPHALDAEDVALLLRTMRGPAPGDGMSRGLFPTGLHHPLTGRSSVEHSAARIRWVEENGFEDSDPAIVSCASAAVDELAKAIGATVDRRGDSMEAPRFNEAFYTMMQADRHSTGGGALLENSDAASRLTSYARHHFEKARALSAYDYSQAVDVQLAALEHMETLLADVEVLATPTVGVEALRIEPGEPTIPELARKNYVAFTFLMNFTGLPAVSVPCGLVNGMPVGLQLIGRQGSDDLLMDLAHLFQDRLYRLPTSPVAQLSASTPAFSTQIKPGEFS